MIKIHLSRLLGEHRMTQSELARLTGIRPSTISEIYNNICVRIKIEHLNSICSVLGCKIGDILEFYD